MTGESESEEIQGKKDKVISLSVDPLPCPFLLSLSPILLRLLAIYTGDARTRKGKEREGIAQSSHFLLLQLQTCSRSISIFESLPNPPPPPSAPPSL